MEIKIHECKRCGFKGTRKSVRKHLREEHLIKGLHDNFKKRSESNISKASKSKVF